MTESNAESGFEQPVFAAELTPYRSLGRTGFCILAVVTGVALCLNVVFFIVSGAWPIAMFFGLDFALLYGAFWLNYRSARAREIVTVSRKLLSIRKFSPSGRVVEHCFDPFWARFRVRRHEEIGITAMYVTGEGRRTDIGSFLNPDDRESFAAALTGALATVKRRI
ncbi:DUF2244 domain-containing protein [Rhizobiaceae bacterium n13]|uniref:DUF2244 domain-containing protein n=1 Tax=Ferirhizobium litorale TaxID=2927786 RepID=A0AAE3TZS3_9HYPH|nr:DUF2244 domain-containing protein [Fererhizobium litorale]MDI7860396.1 DUF2244 domain-containing protein [Fererhizobium litorale]MDI7920531.1 DUF2244 domain-containing protein [Fererhizobium litorale]